MGDSPQDFDFFEDFAFAEHSRLQGRIGSATHRRVRLVSSSLLRAVELPIEAVERQAVTGVRRVGHRIVIALQRDLILAIHPMIAGRFRWKKAGAMIPGRLGSAAFDFDLGTPILAEASWNKRASLQVVRGEAGLDELDAGGWRRSRRTSRRFGDEKKKDAAREVVEIYDRLGIHKGCRWPAFPRAG